MIDDERARILRMVAEGTVSPSEGAELLEALEPAPEPEPRPTAAMPAMPPPVGRKNAGKSLVLEIESGGDTKVDLRIPLGLALDNRFIPRRAQEYLDNQGIDLSGLLNAVGNWAEADGTLIEIEDGDDRVFIGVK
jgi:hypothetical protein